MSKLFRNCEGTARRDFLKTRAIGAFGALGMVDLLRARAMGSAAALASGKSSPSPVNCIMIWLDGAPVISNPSTPSLMPPRKSAANSRPFPRRYRRSFSRSDPEACQYFRQVTVLSFRLPSRSESWRRIIT